MTVVSNDQVTRGQAQNNLDKVSISTESNYSLHTDCITLLHYRSVCGSWDLKFPLPPPSKCFPQSQGNSGHRKRFRVYSHKISDEITLVAQQLCKKVELTCLKSNRMSIGIRPIFSYEINPKLCLPKESWRSMELL